MIRRSSVALNDCATLPSSKYFLSVWLLSYFGTFCHGPRFDLRISLKLYFGTICPGPKGQSTEGFSILLRGGVVLALKHEKNFFKEKSSTVDFDIFI